MKNLYLYFVSYTCTTEHILVLRILYLFYITYSCISGLILVLQILHGAYYDTKVPVGTIQIPYTEVPVGTSGLILILSIRTYPEVLLRYYGTYSGIAELILVFQIRKYPKVLHNILLVQKYP